MSKRKSETKPKPVCAICWLVKSSATVMVDGKPVRMCIGCAEKAAMRAIDHGNSVAVTMPDGSIMIAEQPRHD